MFHKLSIIIPTYNERGTFSELIRRVKAVDFSPLEREIVVVDDGSTDGTCEIIQNTDGIRYFFHEKNLGKGGAVKTGIKNATGDIVIVQDADLEYDPQEIPNMIKPILNGRTEATNGVRIDPPHDIRRRKSLYWISWFANHVITWTTNLLYWHNAGEYEGCYKAFTKKLVDSIPVHSNSFNYENELLCKILKQGHILIDVPIHYYPRSYAEGKKINWKHGFQILWTIIRTRFTDN